jgi:signal transduction histidine kinase
VVIILLGGIISYEILKSHINNQFNRQLLLEKEQLIFELETYENVKETYYLNIGDRIDLQPIVYGLSIDPILSDTVMYDSYANEDLAFRQYTFSTRVDDQNYKVTIWRSMLSTEELIESVGKTMLILLSGLLLALVLVNRYLSKTIWGPFYRILGTIRHFDITKPFSRPKTETNVDEFIELNEAMGEILQRNAKEYLSLKEFTENSSHEIQTPLAIIKSKSELLIQSTRINEEEIHEIKSIYDSALRLSKLNQSLTLLAKIENNQFVANQTLKIASYLDELLLSVSELVEIRKLSISRKFRSNPEIVINDGLADILFTNLIKNAIMHNLDGGFVEIRVNESEIIFSNSGETLQVDPKNLFDRFKKGDFSSSPGLGLSLVKKISDIYGFQVAYTYSKGVHKITLSI